MADQLSLVKNVVEILHDGEKGFEDIGSHLKDPELKAFFQQESVNRGEYAKQLEAELTRTSGEPGDIGGTATGAIHRTWGSLKSNLGGGDHTLLETAEQGEDAAKRAYKEALEGEIDSPVLRETLLRQQMHIHESHDKVKAFRDNLVTS